MNQQQEEEEQFLKKLITAGIIFEELGFEPATKCTLGQRIRQISPDKTTAMYDSWCQGIELQLKLFTVLRDLGFQNVYNFVHIVLTDGDDNASKSKIEQVGILMALIGKTLNAQVSKTYAIGIGISEYSQAAKDLKFLTQLGGENAEYIAAQDDQIEQIFNKIILQIQNLRRIDMIHIENEQGQIGIARQVDRTVLTARKAHYCVLFNLDISGSMSERGKWNQVCKSVEKLISQLQEGDLIGCIVFNDKCILLKPNQQSQVQQQYNQQPYIQIQQQQPQPQNQQIQNYNNYSNFNIQSAVRNQENREGKCLRGFMYFLNIILLLASLCAIGFSIYLLIMNGFISQVGAILLIVLGILVTFVSIGGICIVKSQNKCCIALFQFFVLLFFLISASLSFFFIYFGSQIISQLNSSQPPAQSATCNYLVQLDCQCGNQFYTDWIGQLNNLTIQTNQWFGKKNQQNSCQIYLTLENQKTEWAKFINDYSISNQNLATNAVDCGNILTIFSFNVQEIVFGVLQYIEQTYSCSGICFSTPYYVFSDINNTPSGGLKNNCYSGITQEITTWQTFLIIPSCVMTGIFLAIMIMSCFLCCKKNQYKQKLNQALLENM